MRILVTGGAGFIGSNLCERLLKDGHEVVCLDNLYTGRKENIAEFEGSPRFEFIRHDVQEPIRLEVDQIYHLACPASPPHYQQNPIYTLKTSFLGTLNMLGLAKRLRVPMLLASTSEVYGDPLVHPQVEEYWGNVNPIGIRSCYDEGKRAAETLASDYQRFHGVDARIVRIFNTYGPKMDPNDGRVVSNFILQALRGEPLTVYGAGSQTRSFCYVDDMVEAFVRVMAASECPGPINLGNPGEFTMVELAQKVLDMTGSASRVIYRDLPQDDPTRRKPDITKARRILDWELRVSLDEGLTRTIQYFRSRVIATQSLR
ncbi:MAG TPA: UDP-glucuronic acid decarboxylase family protein [Symbiobacteriaceae bacterium]|jgi:UDP-glucuronate decarboxylase